MQRMIFVARIAVRRFCACNIDPSSINHQREERQTRGWRHAFWLQNERGKLPLTVRLNPPDNPHKASLVLPGMARIPNSMDGEKMSAWQTFFRRGWRSSSPWQPLFVRKTTLLAFWSSEGLGECACIVVLPLSLIDPEARTQWQN